MYLDSFSITLSKQAVQCYVELVERWINNVENNLSLDECYPLNAKLSEEVIKMLRSRTTILKKKIIPEIDEINLQAIDNL